MGGDGVGEAKTGSSRELTLANIEANIQKLIERNDGWCVSGSHVKCATGQILTNWCGIRMVVIGESNEQEAAQDCATLGLPFAIKTKFYYRVMAD